MTNSSNAETKAGTALPESESGPRHAQQQPARERPILMSAPMVRAILDGRKSQTRRAVKPQPPPECGIHYMLGNESWMPAEKRSPLRHSWEAWGGPLFESRQKGHMCGSHDVRCPYGVPGDRLWVRETHAQFAVGEGRGQPVPQCVAYRATCDAQGGFDYVTGGGEIMRIKVTKWTPAIHMPRWASRFTLELTGVRVERLQDISNRDCIREGIYPLGPEHDTGIPHREYRELWEQINGAGSWDANPWVWVLEFRRIASW